MADNTTPSPGRKVRVAIGALLVIIVIGIGGYFVYAQTDTEEADPGRVDAQVVDYYSELCEAVTPVADIPRSYYSAYEQSIGSSVPGRNRHFQQAGKAAGDSIDTAVTDLGAMEDDAPRDVKSDPNDVTGTDYSAAVAPLADELSSIGDELDVYVTDPDMQSSDEAKSRAAINELGTYVSGVPASLSEGIGAAFDNAPVFSPGTRQAIENSEQCAPLMTSDPVGTDVVVESIVSAVSHMETGETNYERAIEDVGATVIPKDPAPSDAATRSAQMWSALAGDLDTVAAGIASWSNTEDPDTPEHAVADQVHPVMGELSAQYRDFSDWAREAASVISESDSPRVLTRTSEALSREFTDLQVDMARAQATARIDVPIPNRATLGEL